MIKVAKTAGEIIVVKMTVTVIHEENDSEESEANN